MHGRCLTYSIGNVADLDLFIKNNKHFYDIFVYGFQQESNLSAEVIHAVKSTIDMNLLIYLSSQPIHNSIQIDEIKLSLKKNASAEIPVSIISKIVYLSEKNIKADNIMSVKADINLIAEKLIRTHETRMSFLIGTLNRGKVVSDIEELFCDDIENLTVDELCRGLINVNGLRLGLVKPTKIFDIEDSTVSQIEEMTIDEICFTRIH